LPHPAAPFLPHGAPIRSISRILSVDCPSGEQSLTGLVEVLFEPDSLFVDHDPESGSHNVLDPAALLELMAQAFAAVSGYAAASRGESPRPGYLVGCRELRIFSLPPSDAALLIETHAMHGFGGFLVFNARALSQEQLIASAEIKVWLP
jgi:predicted hotdog family 3-hydroxylacyl-ACP dehydratase